MNNEIYPKKVVKAVIFWMQKWAISDVNDTMMSGHCCGMLRIQMNGSILFLINFWKDT